MFRKGLFLGLACMLLTGVGLALPNDPAVARPNYNGNLTYAYHTYEWVNQDWGARSSGPWGLGSERSFGTAKRNLYGYRFNTYGDGYGRRVKNDAGHAANGKSRTARIYFNSYGVMGCWCGNVYDDVWRHYARDLTVTHNDNASHKWVG